MRTSTRDESFPDGRYANWIPLLLGTIDINELDVYWRLYLGFE